MVPPRWGSGIAAVFGVGAAVGLANGLLVTFVGLAPFVVTLISYAVAGSLAFVITDGHSIAILDPDFWVLNGGAIVPGIVNSRRGASSRLTVVRPVLATTALGSG